MKIMNDILEWRILKHKIYILKFNWKTIKTLYKSNKNTNENSLKPVLLCNSNQKFIFSHEIPKKYLKVLFSLLNHYKLSSVKAQE